MQNPFQELKDELDSIKSLILSLQPVKEIPAGAKVEQPISQAEASVFLGKSRATLIAWRRKGLIKAYRISGRIYYKPTELLSALKEQ